MHALKHPFWVLNWQLVGAVRPHGGLVGAREKLQWIECIYMCVCVCAFFQGFRIYSMCQYTSFLHGQVAHTFRSVHVPLPGCVCSCVADGRAACQALPGGCAVPQLQSGPGRQPRSTAAWQAALALGWPLPPPGRPHSLTSLAWQERPNKLRAPWSSQHFHGNIFSHRLPFSVFKSYGVCAVHRHTPMSKQWLLRKRVSKFVFERTYRQEDASICSMCISFFMDKHMQEQRIMWLCCIHVGKLRPGTESDHATYEAHL